MEKFDAEAYVNNLPIEKVKMLTRDNRTTFWFHVRNTKGSNSIFVASSEDLTSWIRFRNLFLKYAGFEIPDVPKEMRNQALMQIIHVIKEKAIPINGNTCEPVNTGVRR